MRRVLLAILATAVIGASSARNCWALPPSPAPTSRDESHTLGSSFLERFANSADGVVWRIDPALIRRCDPDEPSEDPIIRCHRAISGSPIPNKFWSTSVATILNDLGSFRESEAPVDFAPEIAVRFGAGDSSTDLMIDLGKSRIEVISPGLPAVTGTLNDPMLTLAHLIRDAIPKDREYRALLDRAEESLQRSIEAGETIGPFWPDCHQGQGPGEFVYYDQEPVPIERPYPTYPPGATADAKVFVHAFVDAEGRVCVARIIKGRDPFSRLALEAVRRWTFHPASSQGKPVGVWIEIPIDFLFPGFMTQGNAGALDTASGRGDHYEEPTPVSRWEPQYPEFAKEAQIQGSVVLRVSVDYDGTVTDIKVMEGVTGLNEAAINAVKHWKFRPATLNGKPVPASLNVPVGFHF